MKKLDRIWDYLRGNRMGKEANRLEREALSDPFLYEALQGLEKVEGNHEKIVTGLFLEMQMHTGEKKSFRLFYRLCVAAACVLIAGLAMWLLYVPEVHIEMAQMTNVADSIELKAEESVNTEENVHKPEYVEAELAVNKVEKAFVRKRIAEDKEKKAACAVVVSKQVLEESDQKNNEPIHLCSSSMLLSARASRPEKRIEGTVTDEKGQPLPEVIISMWDKTQRSVSDLHGSFMLNVPDSARQLRASFVGMESLVFSIPDSGKVHVAMKEHPGGLSETMVTGYRYSANRRETGRKIKMVDVGKQSVFNQYVADSLRYPEDARRQGIQGKVVLSVHLNKRRHSMRIKVVDKLYPSCDREAIRLVEEFNGNWGTERRDFKVTVRFQLPSLIQH